MVRPIAGEQIGGVSSTIGWCRLSDVEAAASNLARIGINISGNLGYVTSLRRSAEMIARYLLAAGRNPKAALHSQRSCTLPSA
jgi:hypothetical protein